MSGTLSPVRPAANRNLLRDVMKTFLLSKEIFVIFIILADVFIYFVEIRAEGERASNGPGLGEYVRVFDGGFPLQMIEICALETLDNVQRLAMSKGPRQLSPVVVADRVHYQSVALPVPDGIAHPGGIGVRGMC